MKRNFELTIAGTRVPVSIEGPNDGKLRVTVGQDTYTLSIDRSSREEGLFEVTVGSQKFRLQVSPQPKPDEYLVTVADHRFAAALRELCIPTPEAIKTLLPQSALPSAPTVKSFPTVEEQISKEARIVLAPLPGRVIEVRVTVGQPVELGDVILVLEAMKMANEIRSTQKGIVKKVYIQSGEAVEKGQSLIAIE